jgi:UV DNA damage repair endonuclease
LPYTATIKLHPLFADVARNSERPTAAGMGRTKSTGGEEATDLAGETWRAVGREPYCHLSSPRSGWQQGNPKPHADYIDPADLPECWLGREMTVDIEAKAKEQAVLRLMEELRGMSVAG